MAVDQAERTAAFDGHLLRRRLEHATKLLAGIVEDVASGRLAPDRDVFILTELERGETLVDIGAALGVSKQRVFVLAARARARANG